MTIEPLSPRHPAWWNARNRHKNPIACQVRDYMSWHCHGWVPNAPVVPVPPEFFELRDRIIAELDDANSEPRTSLAICSMMAKQSPMFDAWARENLS